jgi:hypothetical protein
MARQIGASGGVTGLVSLVGSPTFKVDVYAWRQKVASRKRSRNGRNQGRWDKTAAFRPGGTLALSGEVVYKGYPFPAELGRNVQGTVTLQFHDQAGTKAKMQLTVRVDDVDVEQKKDSDDTWLISLGCTILANPTLSGFTGTQADPAETAKSDVELYDGLTKTYDPNNLLTGATAQYDIWPLTDSDAAERQRIADLVAAVAAAPRFPGAKVKTASLAPGRGDDFGVVTVALSLTDTVEDVVNPITQTTADPQSLTSNASAAAVNGDPTAPGGDFVERETTTRELHDAATLTSKSYGLRDTKDDVEMPATGRSDDPKDLVDSERITKVHDSATAPATPTPTTTGLVLRAIERVQINRIRWSFTWHFGRTDSQEDIEFPGSPDERDASGLADDETVTQVTASSTPPSTPTPTVSGVKLRRTVSIQLTDAGKWEHRFQFARRTTQDDVEMDGSDTQDDASDLSDSRSITQVQGSVTPSPPSTPAGHVLRRTHTKQLHDTKWAHTFEYGRRTTEEDITRPGTVIRDDASDLGDERTYTAVTTDTATPPSQTFTGYALRHIETEQIHAQGAGGSPGKWRHTLYFGRRTHAEDVTLPGTILNADPSALASTREYTEITTDTATPSSVSFAGYALRSIQTEQIHAQGAGGSPGKWRHTHHFGLRSTEDDVEFDGTTVQDDPQDLEDDQILAEVQGSATPNAAPSGGAPTGLKKREVRTKQITPTKWLHSYHYSKRDHADDHIVGGWEAIDDLSDLEEGGVVVAVTNSVTPAAAPASPQAGAKHVRTRSRQVHDQANTGGGTGKWVHTYFYATRTAAEDITFPGTVTGEDPALLRDRDTKTIIDTNATAPAAPAARTGLVHVQTDTVQLTNAGTPQYRHTYLYARRDSKTEIEQDATVARRPGIDPAEIVTASVIDSTDADWNDGTAAGIAAAAFGRLATGAGADKTYETADARKLNANKALKRIITVPDYRIFRSSSEAYVAEVKAWREGSAVVVWTEQCFQRGSNLWSFLITPQAMRRTIEDFEIRRRVAASSVNRLRDYAGTMNAAQFLDFPAGTVTFRGVDVEENRATAAPRIVEVRHKFRYDSAGQYHDTGVCLGWNLRVGNLSMALAPGFNFALLFGWPAAVLIPADYSIFTDPTKESSLFTR